MENERGLPNSSESEKAILRTILFNDDCFADIADILEADDFFLESNRRIFKAIQELHKQGEKIDRITVADVLDQRGEIGAVGGLSYLVSLDDGLPHTPNIEGYVRIVKEKATLRKAIFAAQNLMNRCMMAGDNAVDILSDAQKTITTLADSQAKKADWVTPVEVIQNYPGGQEAFINRNQGGSGMATPWTPLTELWSGMREGELIIIAGRPGMAKSVWAMQTGHKIAKDQHGAGVFSLEMSKESLVERLLCGIARVDSHKLRAGYLNQNERSKLAAAATDLDHVPLSIDDTRVRTVSGMISAIRKLKAKQPLKAVIVDHLQLMVGVGRKRDKRNDELSEIVHELKHTAVSMDLLMIVLSQLNRQCEIENRQPQLSDLAETGAIEQDADILMFVHRPERYAKNHGREDLHGHAEFITAKSRNGPTGKKDMVFLAQWQRFDCRAEDVGDHEMEN